MVRPEGRRGNGRPQAPAHWGRPIGEDGGSAIVRWRSVQIAKYTGRNFEQFAASMIGYNPSPNPKVVGTVLHASYMIRARMEGIMTHVKEVVSPRDR